ncbi:MAG TPA: GntR family transcriptional regulator [Solirubrobacteraceae bacterium]|jgi:GntR family transcriptional regulator|nr:GntR family transcriptional regulator [Solirubrobacteraceae bacterium]
MIGKLETSLLAERARSAILQAILDDSFDGRLPAEDELARMLDVSRTTIRTALQSLERDGLITRQRAIGTTINRHVPRATLALQHLVGFDWLLRSQGHDVDVTVTAVTGEAPADFREAFELEDSSYLITDKRYVSDGRLVLYIRDAVAAATLVDTKIETPIPASLFEFTKRYCTLPIHHAVARISAAVKGDTRYDTQLELDDGQPFTRLFETHYASNASVVGHSVIDVDDRFVQLQVFRREPF